ncbi:hypothetical protein CFT12S00416_07880 [Campylobacter fetus subsp. testudinum]|uniref:hypothetical protein n=1 Tax=Campylobacter fetus TaxID=196 RepID=UPI000818BC25|nr:hypothetical protein [Campylobacter fetus]OCR87737.1 hypothetical protein CFT12S00416_07880 [Campylobacter fetus subsp. testudinum]OCR98882.1 hypothetical protein A9K75_09485 [Campylobacter fetus subsp. testudinum]
MTNKEILEKIEQKKKIRKFTAPFIFVLRVTIGFVLYLIMFGIIGFKAGFETAGGLKGVWVNLHRGFVYKRKCEKCRHKIENSEEQIREDIKYHGERELGKICYNCLIKEEEQK